MSARSCSNSLTRSFPAFPSSSNSKTYLKQGVAMRRISFCTEEYYHLYNRGVEKRTIFLDGADYHRFLTILDNFKHPEGDTDNLLVSIVCYCLMPNHFHLIVQQKQGMGISKFIQRVATGYTMYFNKRYERSGVLFQSKFKAKHIENDKYLVHLARYIHLNPLDLLANREGDDFFVQLQNYQWSSFPAYSGQRSHSIVGLDKSVVLGQFESTNDFIENIRQHVAFDSAELSDVEID